MFTLHVGRKELFTADDPRGRFAAIFEDHGEMGYFYAWELGAKQTIVDAVRIYNVTNVKDAPRPPELEIIWSSDGSKCALLINHHPHAVFDFVARRGYCRPNFPNFEDSHDWRRSDHRWSDDAAAWLAGDGTSSYRSWPR
jgi:hypothetical protein